MARGDWVEVHHVGGKPPSYDDFVGAAKQSRTRFNSYLSDIEDLLSAFLSYGVETCGFPSDSISFIAPRGDELAPLSQFCSLDVGSNEVVTHVCAEIRAGEEILEKVEAELRFRADNSEHPFLSVEAVPISPRGDSQEICVQPDFGEVDIKWFSDHLFGFLLHKINQSMRVYMQPEVAPPVH